MQKDPPIGGLSTFTFRGTSSVPQGLNGCSALLTTTLPKSLSHGMTMLDDKHTLLQVNILQFAMEGHESKTSFLGGASTATSPTCSTMVPPP